MRAKWREPADEILRARDVQAQKQNGGYQKKKFARIRVGSRSVLKVSRFCLGLKIDKNVLSNGCRSLTSLKPLQSCEFAPNV